VSESSGFFTIRFRADLVQLVLFRAGLDRWLRELEWPEAERVDLLLAVGEVSGNAVDHAYLHGEAGEVEVTGRLVVAAGRRSIVVVVRDHGRWRSDHGGDGFGFTTVRACTARLRISHDDAGTVVTMNSRPVPLGSRTGVA
jgi:anti-sigma regulatory factor (Ser/Thr protein kinase)